MKIERMNKGSWGKVRAFFDIQTDEGFTIKGFKLIEGINGLFVSLPSQKGKEDEYFDTVYVASEIREELNHIAIQTYGIQSDDNDSFGFPEKATTKTVEKETPTEEDTTVKAEISETDDSKDETPEKEKVESNTFSDDDIPF